MLWLLKQGAALTLKLVNPLAAITKELSSWKAKEVDAEVESQRIEAQVRVAALEAQRDLLLKEQDNLLTRLVRPSLVYPFSIYLWKAIVWDKVVKGNWEQGVTDSLSADMWSVFMIIVAAYFSFRGVEKVFKIFKG